MVTGPAVQLEIDPSLIGTLELAGFEVPYVDLEDELFVHTRLRVGDTEYTYERSYPIKGHSAVMPGAIAELQAQGRRVLVAERNERYLVYVA
jgi:hypothetical protein